MQAKQLIGKRALRTEPVNLGNGIQDYSYNSGTPITIIKVTDNHIVYQSFGQFHTVDKRWIDDKWIDYDDLICRCNSENN